MCVCVCVCVQRYKGAVEGETGDQSTLMRSMSEEERESQRRSQQSRYARKLRESTHCGGGPCVIGNHLTEDQMEEAVERKRQERVVSQLNTLFQEAN